MPEREQDPMVSFHYALELGGKAAGFFTECSGVGSESEVVEHKIIDKKGNEIVRKIPGRLKWQDITLKRPVTKRMDLWEWQKEVDSGQLSGARIDGSIVMFDQTGEEAARWNFENAWLKKIGGPSLKSDSSDVTMDEVVIVHERLYRAA